MMHADPAQQLPDWRPIERNSREDRHQSVGLAAFSRRSSRAEAANWERCSFDIFFQREWAPVVRVTFALCRRRMLAEEIAQDAFLAAFGNWDKVSRYERPDLWVRRVAVNRATSLYRTALVEALATKPCVPMRGAPG